MEEYRNENNEAMENEVNNGEDRAEYKTEKSGNGLGFFILGGLTVLAAGAAVKGGKFISKKIKEAKAKKSEKAALSDASSTPAVTVNVDKVED